MAVLRPSSEPELAEMVRAAAADRHTLEIMGAGTKRALGRPVRADACLDLSALRGIISYDAEELVLCAASGTPLEEIAAELAAHRQCLGFDPADWGPLFGLPALGGTIGGALAADVSGSRRLLHGAAREHLLGIRAVNGWGKAYKAGGKVVKNVTGFDISKLMCGSLGILGPLSEVTLRLLPKPEQSACLVVRGLEPEQGLHLLRRIWREPLEASALVYLPNAILEHFDLGGSGEAGLALLRVEGSTEALNDKRMRLRALLESLRVEELEHGDQLFTAAANGSVFASSALDVWRMTVPPSTSAEVAAALVGTLWYADWAGGLFWIATSRDTLSAAAGLERICARAQGQLQLLRADESQRLGFPARPSGGQGVVQLMRTVKSAFDPLALFNPGRMYEGL
ncbi:MAG: FAD-binding protein [Rhizomicrobium sp.]